MFSSSSIASHIAAAAPSMGTLGVNKGSPGRKRSAVEMDVEGAKERPRKRFAKRVAFDGRDCFVPRVGYNHRPFSNGDGRPRSILRSFEPETTPERVCGDTCPEGGKKAAAEPPGVVPRPEILAFFDAMDPLDGADLQEATLEAFYPTQAEEARTAREASGQLLAELAEPEEGSMEEMIQREREEEAKEFWELRRPTSPLVTPLSSWWTRRSLDTLRASSATNLATTPDGTSLRRHCFQRVVSERGHLSEEIVHGTFLWLDEAINSAAGITNVKSQTRKCLSLSPSFWKQLMDKGGKESQRALRRYGVSANNLLNIETIFIPVCQNDHWNLSVIRPSNRTISHMDPLDPDGYCRRTDVTLSWLESFLGDKFALNEWKVVNHHPPRQINAHDSGVHTITNGMCIALGLHPGSSFDAHDMPMQRLRIASMLLNNGFTGDFDLSKI